MCRMIGLASCALALPLLACGVDEHVEVPTPPGEEVSLTPSSRFSVSVYGHDAYLADASATRILRRVEPATALPLVFELVLPADPHTLIDQGHGPVSREDARFYLAGIYVDVDGDGQVCAGDLRQDFEVNELVHLDVDGPIGPFSISMTRSTGPCQAFPD